MQGLRLKFGSDRRNDWRCCLCCHVRTGTIFLGIWHLVLHVMMLSLMALVLRHSDLPDREMDPVLPTPLSEVDNDHLTEDLSGPGLELTLHDGSSLSPSNMPHNYKDLWGARFASTQDMNVGFVVTFCTFAMTLLLLFGAVKGKPSYLMPFFCLQVFEFCINCLTAVGYLCYPTNFYRIVERSNSVPFKGEVLQMNPQTLSLLVALFFLLGMAIKAYFIGVVWSCYKYLTLRQVAAQRTVQFIDPDFQNLLPDLPDYETAIKKYPTPPPSYDNAMRAQLPVVVDVNRYTVQASVAPPGAAVVAAPTAATCAATGQVPHPHHV